VENFFDDDYMVQVNLDLNSGDYGDIWFRYVDANNGYLVRLDSTNSTAILYAWEDGAYSVLSTLNTFPGSDVAVKIKVDGTSIKVWFDGTKRFDVTDSTIDAGGVGFGGEQAKFDNLKIGYDNNSDDDIDDAGDDVILDEDFASTQVSLTYDDAGNLIDDGVFVYVYDAWNRLVKVRSSEDSDITIQTAEFDGRNRRIKKVVTNSGDYDETVIYLYDGFRIIETRDGSSNVVQQFVYGTQYIDELLMVRVKDQGELYIHQDANWNVIALTDLGGHVVERYTYRPYGEMVVFQDTSYGDYDGDQDVDTTDRDAYTGSSPSGAERILDLDFDGDVDATDTTLFNNNIETGISRHPGRRSTGVDQPFGHQGLLFDAEVTSYQNRYRQYSALMHRFMQRDPMGYVDGMSLYQYCASNSIKYKDPLGNKLLGNKLQPPLTCPWGSVKFSGKIKHPISITLLYDSIYTWVGGGEPVVPTHVSKDLDAALDEEILKEYKKIAEKFAKVQNITCDEHDLYICDLVVYEPGVKITKLDCEEKFSGYVGVKQKDKSGNEMGTIIIYSSFTKTCKGALIEGELTCRPRYKPCILDIWEA
jgi:RHS repeat-associated protein